MLNFTTSAVLVTRTWRRRCTGCQQAPSVAYRKSTCFGVAGVRLCAESSPPTPAGAASLERSAGAGTETADGGVSGSGQGFTPSITADNESQYYATRLVVTCRDRKGLLSDLTDALKSIGLQIRRAVARTKDGIASDEFFVTRDGSQLSDTDLDAVEQALQPVMGTSGPTCPVQQNIERRLPAPQSPVRFVDHNRGVHVYVDNHASQHYTTITVNAPDRPNLLNEIIDVLHELELNITFACLSTYADENKYRHDIFHVTTMSGEQVDAVLRDEIMNTLYFLLTSRESDEQSF
jgi:UTP:GlnB (protein PII) uridylyltransferase